MKTLLGFTALALSSKLVAVGPTGPWTLVDGDVSSAALEDLSGLSIPFH